MTPEKAREIAHHHLGDRLHWVQRGGPHASEWLVQAVPLSGHMIHATAATPEAAARDAADQLRAQGWVPTHPRLEWADNRLYLCIGRTRFVVATYLLPGADLLFHPGQSGWIRGLVAAGIAAECAEWCAANLPSLHLPLFPGADNA